MIAATGAIARSGLGALRARGLADVCLCSVGAIYGVFPDLDGLILEVNGRTLDAIAEALQAAGTGRDAADQLVRLALAYLDYADTHINLWRALFAHRMPDGAPIPDWYADRQFATFALIEAPILMLQPDLTKTQRVRLARTLFSAVHGMVDLGLEEKVAGMKVAVLRTQLRTMVQAMAKGLAH